MFNDIFKYSDGKIYRHGESKEAGTDKGNGYRMVCVRGKKYLTHRVIWEMINGNIPYGLEIDHIDGNRSNNRIDNLRLVKRSNNNKNKSKQLNNTSGVTGVTWCKKHKKWIARYKLNGKQVQIGRFDNLDDARNAREKVAMKIFSERHGK